MNIKQIKHLYKIDPEAAAATMAIRRYLGTGHDRAIKAMEAYRGYSLADAGVTVEHKPMTENEAKQDRLI